MWILRLPKNGDHGSGAGAIHWALWRYNKRSRGECAESPHSNGGRHDPSGQRDWRAVRLSADELFVPSSATPSVAPSPDLFWTALNIVSQWRALRQEEIAAFERAFPGSEGQWDHVEAIPIGCYPWEVSPPTRDLVAVRNQINACRQRLWVEWKKIHKRLLVAGIGLVRDTFDSGEADHDLRQLLYFPAFGDDAEAVAVSSLLTKLARRADCEAIEARAADLARQLKRTLDADIILGIVAAPGSLKDWKMIAAVVGATPNTAIRMALPKLKRMGVVVKEAGFYSLTEFGRRVAALLSPSLPPQMS
jgi:hypothetical protein